MPRRVMIMGREGKEPWGVLGLGGILELNIDLRV